jgi:hypothetical protein
MPADGTLAAAGHVTVSAFRGTGSLKNHIPNEKL